MEKHVDYTGSKIGMWLFLFTELILFGGMFLLYSVYRYKHPQEFHAGAAELDVVLGAFNTVILLTSSMTMALSILALRKGNKKLSLILQLATIGLGLLFLVNKYFEWGAKIHHGLYPGSEQILQRSKGEILFFGLYYTMTGLHGLHVLIGLAVIGFTVYMTHRERITGEDFVILENTGLYWHLVDIIWIYLFPLFYLIT
ncbi:MAG: cytochrome c oxidase subunit 3 family protein [Deltaproteobacteria bacterium]|nr:cytochrome c oxidase subunit 3 family protein [Deltaproteobacteria bacterium]NIS77705.1 cytochrome c oxidase subunit 3 family protein [Deltaproteobacteria bacterium]